MKPQSATRTFLEGFAEAPTDMIDAMSEMEEMTAMPRIGDTGTKYCPSVQLNIARPQLYTSRNCLYLLCRRLTYTLFRKRSY